MSRNERVKDAQDMISRMQEHIMKGEYQEARKLGELLDEWFLMDKLCEGLDDQE